MTLAKDNETFYPAILKSTFGETLLYVSSIWSTLTERRLLSYRNVDYFESDVIKKTKNNNIRKFLASFPLSISFSAKMRMPLCDIPHLSNAKSSLIFWSEFIRTATPSSPISLNERLTDRICFTHFDINDDCSFEKQRSNFKLCILFA